MKLIVVLEEKLTNTSVVVKLRSTQYTFEKELLDGTRTAFAHHKTALQQRSLAYKKVLRKYFLTSWLSELNYATFGKIREPVLIEFRRLLAAR